MAWFTSLREIIRKRDGSRVYGCLIHIDRVKHWIGQWSSADQAAIDYNHFVIQEYEDRALKKLNFPASRHRAAELASLGLRHFPSP